MLGLFSSSNSRTGSELMTSSFNSESEIRRLSEEIKRNISGLERGKSIMFPIEVSSPLGFTMDADCTSKRDKRVGNLIINYLTENRMTLGFTLGLSVVENYYSGRRYSTYLTFLHAYRHKGVSHA